MDLNNIFKRYKSVVFVIFFTVVSVLYFIYIYKQEIELKKEQKEFLTNITHLQIDLATLQHMIYRVYIETYNDNDIISQKIKDINYHFDKIKHSKLLKRKNYKTLKNDTKQLQSAIENLTKTTTKFLMINSPLKNSLIYIINFTTDSSKKLNQQLANEAYRIIQNYLSAKNLTDVSVLENKTLTIPESLAKNEYEKKFILVFNRHSKFLNKNLPLIIKHISTVKNIDTNQMLNGFLHKFSDIYVKDLQYIKYETGILVFILAVLLLSVIYLLTASIKQKLKIEEDAKELDWILHHDTLTKLRNRYSINKDIAKLKNPSILLINIDRFKDINDIYGNKTGDKVLLDVSKLIKSFFENKAHFKIYRVGGDEFAVLFENTPKKQVLEYVYSLSADIQSHTFFYDNLKLNISVGIAYNDIKPVFENADLALKHLKRNTNKSVIEYTDNLNLRTNIQNNITILSMIKEAIESDGVVPFFQPIVDLQSCKIVKYEALMRIKHKGKVYLPYQFLDIVSKTVYYNKLTKIMIEKVMQTAKKNPRYRFSINLSMKDLEEESTLNILFETLGSDPITASKIDVEILEVENITDINTVADFINKLHSFGCEVLIDDFGSGYSNFSYFANLEIDILKIDGSIVDEIATNKRKYHMLKSIVMFSKGMNIENVAEFVDDTETLKLLKESGVRYAQGFLFSPPVEELLPETQIDIECL